LDFCGVVVNQDGHPLAGAVFSFEIEIVPPGLKLGEPFNYEVFTATSVENGRISFRTRGKLLWIKQSTLPGYDRLVDSSPASTSNFYSFHQDGEDLMRFDWENQAVFVFVKDGETDVHVLPSAGGYLAFGFHEVNFKRVRRWDRVKPAWPNEPSIPGVRYVAPATQESN